MNTGNGKLLDQFPSHFGKPTSTNRRVFSAKTKTSPAPTPAPSVIDLDDDTDDDDDGLVDLGTALTNPTSESTLSTSDRLEHSEKGRWEGRGYYRGGALRPDFVNGTREYDVDEVMRVAQEQHVSYSKARKIVDKLRYNASLPASRRELLDARGNYVRVSALGVDMADDEDEQRGFVPQSFVSRRSDRERGGVRGSTGDGDGAGTGEGKDDEEGVGGRRERVRDVEETEYLVQAARGGGTAAAKMASTGAGIGTGKAGVSRGGVPPHSVLSFDTSTCPYVSYAHAHAHAHVPSTDTLPTATTATATATAGAGAGAGTGAGAAVASEGGGAGVCPHPIWAEAAIGGGAPHAHAHAATSPLTTLPPAVLSLLSVAAVPFQLCPAPYTYLFC